MKLLSHNKLFDILNKTLLEYNNQKNTSLALIVTGSYALQEHNLINRRPNDIDLCFVNENNFELEKDFIYFLNKKISSIIEREDDNLVTLDSKEYGKIEFVLLNYINKAWSKKISEYLYVADYTFLILGKITMLNYVMSEYYLHDNKLEKIANTLEDIIYIDKQIKFFDNFKSTNQIKNCLFSIINNSTLIFIYYNYEKFLWWDSKFNEFGKNNDKYVEILKNIDLFFKDVNNDVEITEYINFSNEIVKCFYLGFVSNIKDKFYFISPAGNEQIFIENAIKEASKEVGGYKLNNSSYSNLIFMAHADEVMGIILNNQVYNLGTINWKLENDLDIYDIEGKKLYENVKFKINNNYIFSTEKDLKINRPKIELLNVSQYNLSKKIPYYIVSNQKCDIKNFNFINRNNDNKINVLILKSIYKNLKNNPQVWFTSSEEVGLFGIKALKEKINNKTVCINLEVSQWDTWQKHGLLIRTADFFSPMKKDFLIEIIDLFNYYSIPYELYYGSGSTDITEITKSNKAITIAIPSNLIHSMSSKINIANIVYIMKIIWAINKKFNF